MFIGNGKALSLVLARLTAIHMSTLIVLPASLAVDCYCLESSQPTCNFSGGAQCAFSLTFSTVFFARITLPSRVVVHLMNKLSLLALFFKPCLVLPE